MTATHSPPAARRAPLVTLTSTYVVLDADDVDTDQIIPARFLTTTQRSGLGRHAFHDRRYTAQGQPRAGFPLDAPDAAGAQVLVTGRNFGCGSSREHAVWALMDCGIRAVVAPSFADIFRANAHANGLLPVIVPEPVARALGALRLQRPDACVTVDLRAQRFVTPAGRAIGFELPPFARHCIMHGMDELELLVSAEPERVAFEATRRIPLDTRLVLSIDREEEAP